MNDKKRGRPKKEETKPIPKNSYAQITVPKEGILIRENNKSKIFKFENPNYLYNYLLNFLNPNIPSPLGIIIYNASKQNDFNIRHNLSFNLPNYENINIAAKLITDDFVNYRNSYNQSYNSNAKVLCYTSHINLDMNRYRNLSVIYQIIYEIQQRLFANQFTIWKLQAPVQSIYPFYVLRLIVSNVCVNNSGYISYMFSGDIFNNLVGEAYGIINGILSYSKDSKIDQVMINPIGYYDQDIPHYTTKPDNYTYAKWNEITYGNLITNRNPNRMINLRSYDYSRDKNTNNNP